MLSGRSVPPSCSLPPPATCTGQPQAQCQPGAETSQDVWDSSCPKDRLAQGWKPAPGLPWGDHDLAHGFPAHETWLGRVPPGTPGKASQMPFGCICLEGLWAETLANAHCAPVPARAWHRVHSNDVRPGPHLRPPGPFSSDFTRSSPVPRSDPNLDFPVAPIPRKRTSFQGLAASHGAATASGPQSPRQGGALDLT